MHSSASARSATIQCNRAAMARARHAPPRRAMATPAAQILPQTSEPLDARLLVRTVMDKSAPGAGKRPLPDFPHIAEARQQPMDLESVTPGATARTGPMTGGEMALLRKQTLRRLSTLLTKKFGRGYRVELFGSTLYARSLESDMDVIILDDARPHGFEPGVQDTPPPIYSVEKLANLLKRHGYQNITTIPNASVPIVKLTDPETGMSCDMNVNSRLGLYNSWLLRHYCMFKYPFVPNLIRGVKTWAKSKNLNNPSATGLTVSFSSYSLALMTIAYLQHLGALPNCQADPDPIFRTHFWEGRGSNSRNITVRYGACKGWKPSGRVPSVGEWLKFYGERFDYTTQMISIRHGGIIRRPQHLPPDPEYSHFRGSIVVLDPFLNKNCTRFIKEETLQEFRAKCSVGAADSIRRWESLKARHQTQARSQSDDEEEPDPWTDLMASR